VVQRPAIIIAVRARILADLLDSGMVFQLMRLQVVQQQFQKVHQKIWEVFVSFEDIQACDSSLGLKDQWGKVYNDWMNHVLTVNQRLAADVSKLSVAVAKPEVTGKPGQKNAFGRAVDALGIVWLRGNRTGLIDIPDASIQPALPLGYHP